MPNIYKLTLEERELVHLLDESKGEITPDIDAKLAVYHQSLQGCCAVFANMIEELDALAEARKAKGKELIESAKAVESARDKLKDRLLSVIVHSGQDSVTIGGLVVSKRKTPPSLNVTNESLVPDKYKRITAKLRADALDEIKALLNPEQILSITEPEVMKDEIKKLIKESKGEFGIAGTEIVSGFTLNIKG